MAGEVEKRGSGGLRMADGLVLVAVGVVGVLVAFWVLSAVAGLIWGVVKFAVLIAVVAGILWLLFRRRRD